MADVVVSTPTETVSVPLDKPDTEVDSQWLESSLNGIRSQLATLETANLEGLNRITESLNLLVTRLPENLLMMLESQQRTITQLVHDSQETLRSLLTPTPAVQETITEPVPVESAESVVTPESSAPVAKEVTVQKRRKI